MNLYHASQNKNLSLLTPQPTMSNDKYIGDYLFATKNYNMALMYLTPKGIPILMNPDDSPNIVICSSLEEFKKKDTGGAVYSLPADTFIETPQEGLSNYEMVSKVAVQPIKNDTFSSVLSALIDAGIQVKFTSDVEFKSLIGNKNQKEIIQKLHTYEV